MTRSPKPFWLFSLKTGQANARGLIQLLASQPSCAGEGAVALEISILGGAGPPREPPTLRRPEQEGEDSGTKQDEEGRAEVIPALTFCVRPEGL